MRDKTMTVPTMLAFMKATAMQKHRPRLHASHSANDKDSAINSCPGLMPASRLKAYNNWPSSLGVIFSMTSQNLSTRSWTCFSQTPAWHQTKRQQQSDSSGAETNFLSHSAKGDVQNLSAETMQPPPPPWSTDRDIAALWTVILQVVTGVTRDGDINI